MSSSSLPCPQCGRVLRSAALVPVGTTVKCPNCQIVFVVGHDAGIVEGSPPSRAGQVKAGADGKADFRDDFPQPSPNKKQTSTRTLIILLAALGLLFLVATLGATAYYLMRSPSPRPVAGGIDPFAYVPSDTTLLLSANFSALRNQPEKLKLLQKMLDEKMADNPAARDLIKDLTHFVAAGRSSSSKDSVLIFVTDRPQDPEKLRLSFDAGAAEMIGGHNAYKIQKTQGYLGVPAPRIVVVADRQDLFARAMEAKGPAAALRAKTQPLEPATLWFHVELTPQFLNQAGAGNLDPNLNFLRDAKAVNGFFDVGPEVKYLKARAHIHFANAADAKSLETNARLGWAQASLMIPFLAQGMMQKPGPVADGLKATLNDLTSSVKIEAQGNITNISAELSEATMTLLGRIDEGALRDFSQGLQGFPGGLPIPKR